MIRHLLCCYLLVYGSCEPTSTHLEEANKQDSINSGKQGLNAEIPNPDRSYDITKKTILVKKRDFAERYLRVEAKEKSDIENQITDFWISTISLELYEYWKHTPWDFNGITNIPQKGKIACGFFVTTLLRDMGYSLNRTKLAICPSSEMMRALVPHQKLKNLSHLSYTGFADSLKKFAAGVYIIGLDFHTGFIINDSQNIWFLHSNYIKREGVIKEMIKYSTALRSSKTRWLVSLTGDQNFIDRWLKSQ